MKETCPLVWAAPIIPLLGSFLLLGSVSVLGGGAGICGVLTPNFDPVSLCELSL